MTSANITKAEMFKRTGIGRSTFDAILNGSDARVSTIEKIANVLGRSIGYFFDEENIEIRAAGRDYVEKGKIEYNASSTRDAEYIGSVDCSVNSTVVLEEKIRSLEAIIAEKERLIQVLMKDHVQ